MMMKEKGISMKVSKEDLMHSFKQALEGKNLSPVLLMKSIMKNDKCLTTEDITGNDIVTGKQIGRAHV